MQPDMKKRKFTKEDKLQIIKEASEQGVKVTLEKHGIYPAGSFFKIDRDFSDEAQQKLKKLDSELC